MDNGGGEVKTGSMRLIARLLELLVATLIGLVILVLVVLFLVVPQMQWNASARPSAAERWAARYVLGNWVRMNASSQRNPIPPTPENLRDGERKYDEHCAV